MFLVFNFMKVIDVHSISLIMYIPLIKLTNAIERDILTQMTESADWHKLMQSCVSFISAEYPEPDLIRLYHASPVGAVTLPVGDR